MSLHRLRWLTIVLAISFLLMVQALAMGVVMPNLGRLWGHALSISASTIGVIAFTMIIYRVIGQMQRRIVRQNEELKAMNAVGRAMAGSLDLEQSMNGALTDVMNVTRALAAQIVIEPEAGGRARKFSGGIPKDVSLLERLANTAEAPSAMERKVVAVPLVGQDRRFGTLWLLPAEDGGLNGESEELLAGIGAQIAMAVYAANLYEDVLRRESESQALYEIAVDITSFGEADGILPSIVERARDMVGGNAAALCLSDGESGLVLAARSGSSEPFRAHPPGTAWRSFIPVSESDAIEVLNRLPACPLSDPAFKRVCAPLRVGARTVGELCVSAGPSHQFTSKDQHLVGAMADLAAIAVQKATLLEKERQVAVLEERARLAREMHDSLAQVLGYLHLKAQDTQRMLMRNDVPKVAEELADMASVAHEAYADVREAILALREPVLSDGGITGTLKEYLSKYSRRAGIRTEFVVEGDWRPRFSPEVSVQLVRVVQEALTNVRKHAHADLARVQICRQGNEAVIVVEDDGKGFDPQSLQQTDILSFGLRTMRERVERVGGRFAVDSVPGEGTRVQIFLPVNGGQDHDVG